MFIKLLVVSLTVIFMTAGLIGSVIPVIPGPLLILAGAFLYAWHSDFQVITWTGISVLAFFALFSQALDYLASMVGAKKFGASLWGIIGAFAGGIIGIFLGGLPGVIIGPFLGAFSFEILNGKNINAAIKIGFGTFIGFLAGTIGRFVIAITMIGVFLYQIIT